jgi:hypothetical protein
MLKRAAFFPKAVMYITQLIDTGENTRRSHRLRLVAEPLLEFSCKFGKHLV